MKILIDMNLSPDWVAFLTQHGLDAVHWTSVGDTRASDATIMAWARHYGYVVFTHDLDFGAILAATHARSPSVIQARTRDVMPAQLGQLFIRTIEIYERELSSGAIVTIDAANSKVRLLPL